MDERTHRPTINALAWSEGMSIESDKAIMKSLFQKYQNIFGYITFENHLNVYSDFMAQGGYEEIEGGLTKEQFEIRRKGMMVMMEIIKDIVKTHKVQGIPCIVDLEGL
jgi:hypothetical protein